jgi:hypothetical protein
LDQSSGNIVGIKVGGRLSAEDFKTLAAHIEGVIAASPGKVRLLSDLSDFQWMDMAAFWDDLAFSLKHMHDFDRVACAVERRCSLAGANPARQLSLQPVAIGAGYGGNDIVRSTPTEGPPWAVRRPCGPQRE